MAVPIRATENKNMKPTRYDSAGRFDWLTWRQGVTLSDKAGTNPVPQSLHPNEEILEFVLQPWRHLVVINQNTVAIL